VLEKVLMQLPFKGDMDEGKVGVRFVIYLIQNGNLINKFDKYLNMVKNLYISVKYNVI
jgi:hypothetical protein